MNLNSNSYLREKEVHALTKLSKSTRWRLEQIGKFPKRRLLATKAVGWLESEINDWLQSRTFAQTKCLHKSICETPEGKGGNKQ